MSARSVRDYLAAERAGPSKSSRALRHVQFSAEIAARLLDLERSSRRTMTAGQRSDARSWYVVQRIRLERIADEAYTEDVSARVFRDDWYRVVVHAAATLSPATSWGTLLRDLPRFIADAQAGHVLPAFATYGRQRFLAALMIAQGIGEGAQGPKVRPFALALLGDASQVVVDRHVARYSLGLDREDDGSGPRITVRTSELRAIQAAHTLAGGALGIAPRDLQSLLWVARVGYDGDPGGARVKRSRGAP